MANPRQQKLAKEMVANIQRPKPKTMKEVLVSIGYAESTASAMPSEITEGKGVVEELVRLGFTVDNAKAVVTQIMLDDDQDANARLKASDMAFKVHGSYAPDKVEHSGEVKTTLVPEMLAIAEEELKKRKTDDA